MRFRVGYHNTEPMRKVNEMWYDIERGNGIESWCCVVKVEWLQKLKKKTYEI